MIPYGFTKELNMSFDKTVDAVTEELKKEEFGILTRIDLNEKFKEKLNIDFKKYVILGACNPPFALKSLLAEEYIGLMLPCNVILFEKDGKTSLGIIKPSLAMSMIDNQELKQIASDVETKLKRVFDSICER